MFDDRFKWAMALVLLGMFADTVSSHPMLDVKNEYQQHEGVIPQPVLGFANERQWLFAHRKYRNQCVLEALAAESKQSSKCVVFLAARLNDSIALPDLRLRATD
jgi:hypothetical protein